MERAKTTALRRGSFATLWPRAQRCAAISPCECGNCSKWGRSRPIFCRPVHEQSGVETSMKKRRDGEGSGARGSSAGEAHRRSDQRADPKDGCRSRNSAVWWRESATTPPPSKPWFTLKPWFTSKRWLALDGTASTSKPSARLRHLSALASILTVALFAGTSAAANDQFTTSNGVTVRTPSPSTLSCAEVVAVLENIAQSGYRRGSPRDVDPHDIGLLRYEDQLAGRLRDDCQRNQDQETIYSFPQGFTSGSY